ncbi:MAG: PaaI family thioesterase [Planctomycetes bacterium]|nr:PaaI family thioesterase [Planctomycetota bacterium]
MKLVPRRELLQGHAHVHGGVLAALADTAGVWLVYPELAHGVEMTSIEFKLNFLRPATLDAGELVATAKLVKRGRTIALADVDVTQGGELVAKGLFTYLVFELAARSSDRRPDVSSRSRRARRSKG